MHRDQPPLCGCLKSGSADITDVMRELEKFTLLKRGRAVSLLERDLERKKRAAERPARVNQRRVETLRHSHCLW